MTSVGDALFGKTRQAVLALLFGHSEQSFYLRQIAKATGGSVGTVQRELDRLTDAGLTLRHRAGNQVHYRANRESAVYAELVGLITKTFGVADELRSALDPVANRITVALIYGSVARGQHKANSDVDLLIVGDALLSQLDRSLHDAEVRLGRVVSVTLLDVQTYRKRLREDDHFLQSILTQPMIFLIGTPQSLRELDERQPGESPQDRPAEEAGGVEARDERIPRPG